MTGAGDGDGRNIDPGRGILEGEASGQAAPDDRAGSEGGPPFDVWGRVPSQEAGGEADATYYERPLVKEPTWIWSVPAYFFAGGAAGSAAVLAAVAQVVDRRELHGLIRRGRWIAALGGAAGTVLLIMDLGRPERFAHMLRVFRPSSPMNLGSWILATISPFAASSAVLADAGGFLGAVGDFAGINSGLAGIPLTGYTAVLLSSTAIPVWQQTRRTSPPLFVASAVAAGASLLQLLRLTGREERIVTRFAVVGAVAELAAHVALEREAAAAGERVAAPLHEGLGGTLLRAAKACAAASLVATLWPGRQRWKRALAGTFGTAGALAAKFGLFHAGKASARDPRASFRQQREGRGAAEVTGRAAVTSA